MRIISLIVSALEKIDAIIFFGAGRDILKPKNKGNILCNALGRLDYFFFTFLDSLDAKIFFKGRRVRTAKGRVRSRGERKITQFFDRRGIAYAYERQIVLDGITLNPDFYLPGYNVYVEFWGMADFSLRYQRIMSLKKALYRKHAVPIISIYPRHIAKLDNVFANLFQKATGKTLSLEKKGE